ncbi:MAG: hypothetical protein ACRYG8_32285 [Janthinobacterium lividum]
MIAEDLERGWAQHCKVALAADYSEIGWRKHVFVVRAKLDPLVLAPG